MKKISINLDEIDFQFIGAEVIEKCPQNQSCHFEDGFLFYVQDFFSSIHSMTPYLHIDDENIDKYLEFFIKSPLDYLDSEIKGLNHSHKKEFLEGVDLGIEESCKATQLILNPAAFKSVA